VNLAPGEDSILSGETEGIRLKISQLRRQSISIRRYLAPQREAMNRLISENLTWLDELNRLRLREINDRMIRHIEDLDEVRDRAALAQEELLTRVSEQMNERSYIFTIVATIFLPLGFFTGLMGINVGGMPGVEDNTAFWIVVAMCFGLTGLLALVFRLKHGCNIRGPRQPGGVQPFQIQNDNCALENLLTNRHFYCIILTP
jgi:zinc transporter